MPVPPPSKPVPMRATALSHHLIHLVVLCCCCSAAAAEGSEPPPEAQEDDLWDVVEGEVLPPAIRRYLWTRRLKDARKEKVRGGAHRPPPTGWREEGRGGGRHPSASPRAAGVMWQAWIHDLQRFEVTCAQQPNRKSPISSLFKAGVRPPLVVVVVDPCSITRRMMMTVAWLDGGHDALMVMTRRRLPPPCVLCLGQVSQLLKDMSLVMAVPPSMAPALERLLDAVS